jgi:hypothetical protein
MAMSDELKATPGPWRWAHSIVGGKVRMLFGRGGAMVLDPNVRQFLPSPPDSLLMEAAPDLLAACIAMRRTMHSPDSEESRLADAAIAKATGTGG